MNQPRLIGLTGAAGSGKDTAAFRLTSRHRFKNYALASPIKNALSTMFGWHPSLWDNREWKERVVPALGFSPRKAAQTLGTEWGRALREDLWLSLAGWQWEDARYGSNPRSLVITDVRFDNEAQWVREQGGEVWLIRRDGIQAVEAHASEKGVQSQFISKVIFNDQDIETLWDTVDQMLSL